MSNTIDRRTLLVAAPAVALAAAPVAAVHAAGDELAADPIFAALAKERALRAAVNAIPGDIDEEAYDRPDSIPAQWLAAEREVYATAPTTAAGLAALLEFTAWSLSQFGLGEEDFGDLFPKMTACARRLAGLAV